jgi:hypothetical protein
MNFLVMLAALALMPRLLSLLSGRDRIRIRFYEPLGSRIARWGCVEWALIGVAVLTLGLLYLLGLL